jgi:hypothetical protein
MVASRMIKRRQSVLSVSNFGCGLPVNGPRTENNTITTNILRSSDGQVALGSSSAPNNHQTGDILPPMADELPPNGIDRSLFRHTLPADRPPDEAGRK